MPRFIAFRPALFLVGQEYKSEAAQLSTNEIDHMVSDTFGRCWRALSHAVALKHPATLRTELRPVLLQALLNGVIVAQLLPAKSLSVPRACLLLLRRSSLCNRQRTPRQQQCEYQT